jgi:hypothetical protein
VWLVLARKRQLTRIRSIIIIIIIGARGGIVVKALHYAGSIPDGVIGIFQ